MAARVYYSVGETKGIELTLRDGGAALNLTGYQEIRAALADAETGGTTILSRVKPTDTDDLIDVTEASGIVTIYPTLAESLDLAEGTYYLDLHVKLGDRWSSVREQVIVTVRGSQNAPTL